MRNLRIGKEGIIYPDLSYEINGILFKARNKVGQFGTEKQYCDIIEQLLKESGLDYEREKPVSILLDNKSYTWHKIDFVVKKKIIIEAKAKAMITRNDYYQSRRYLEALGLKLALLVNMWRYTITIKRILNPKVKYGT